MKALFEIYDLPDGGIGFTVQNQAQPTDTGITSAGALAFQLAQTLEHIGRREHHGQERSIERTE